MKFVFLVYTGVNPDGKCVLVYFCLTNS